MSKLRSILLGKYATIRHFYLVSFFFALIALFFSVIFLINDYLNFKSDIIDDVKSHNERIEQKFSDSLFYTKLLMSYVGRQIANHESPKDQNFIRNLLASYRMPDNGLMSWSVFSWSDENYQLSVSRTMGIMQEKKDLSMRDYIPLTEKYPGTIHFGKPVFGVISGLWSIPLGYGVADTHRKYIGAVVTGIIIENLKSQIDSMITNRNILFAIIDEKGDVIVKSAGLDLKWEKVFLNKFWHKIEKENKDHLLYKTAYYQKLQGYPYGVITIYNNDVLSSGSQERFVIYLIVVFLLLAFISFIFYGFHSNLVAPISTLSKIAEKIYRNEPHQKIPKFEVAEINELAKNLQKIDALLSQERKSKKHD